MNKIIFSWRLVVPLCSLMAAALLAGCSSQGTGTNANSLPQFIDVTSPAGITWKHNNGAFGLKFTPETMGSGAAFIDADGDGYQDIYLVNSRDWTDEEISDYNKGTGKLHRKQRGFVPPTRPARQRTVGAFYHNNGDGTFSDITKQSGLDIEFFGMGATVGDYDNDGKPDLYLTGWGRNYLFRNQSTREKIQFTDVTDQAGVRDARWSTGAAWLDYDRDGRLDLVVAHYFKWTPATDAYRANAGPKIYTGPDHYPGDLLALYRNAGTGKFDDVSAKAGMQWVIDKEDKQKKMLWGKALGVAICDFNNDLWPDIAVANDMVANQLFVNNQNGTFSEIAEKADIAYNVVGQARAGMGIDAGDIDHTNHESLVITNFSSEMMGLHWNSGQGFFIDVASQAEVAKPTLPYVGFGCAFTDIDLDSWSDIVVANGDVFDDTGGNRNGSVKAEEQRMLVFKNLGIRPAAETIKKSGPAKFEEVTEQCGSALMTPMVGRGLAVADIDVDGDLDLLVTTNGNAPRLLKNDYKTNNAVRVELRGTKSNRSAIGSVVWADNGNRSVRRAVRSGGSYLSQSELPVTLGIGNETQTDIAIRWASGKIIQFKGIPANSWLIVDETAGIVEKKLISRR